MSYQALARKWRPRTFADVVGQEHVVQALSNALDRNQVHHAFLFTGTRGVGKTTLARIFAKALNCEQGVSSTPCNDCSTCTAIDEARFIDLIEVDAASRTKVEDTRDLLDNVQYAPTSGRYKVYLIDEVHMLSGHSFNALLKTLEEPPPHVKFLLATTDPQKLPVTILSRCLQFNLKALMFDQIHQQLQTICESEGVEAESAALAILARAADGSLRDGLSLLDQGLAYGAGTLIEPMVRKMMGTIDDDIAERIMRALIAGDSPELLLVVSDMAERSADYLQALDEILLQIYHLSLMHMAPGSLDSKQAQKPWHVDLAALVDPEELQLYYQIGLMGKRDLSLAPDPRTGFEMTLLRMLSFRPAQVSPDRKPPHSAGAPGDKGAPAGQITTPSRAPDPVVGTSPPAVKTVPQADGNTSTDDWDGLVAGMSVNGVVRELAMNLGIRNRTDDTIYFDLDPSHEYLLDDSRVSMIEDELKKLGIDVSVNIEIKRSDRETPAQQRQKQDQERMQAAERAIEQDPNVRAIQEKFGASIVKESIRVRD